MVPAPSARKNKIRTLLGEHPDKESDRSGAGTYGEESADSGDFSIIRGMGNYGKKGGQSLRASATLCSMYDTREIFEETPQWDLDTSCLLPRGTARDSPAPSIKKSGQGAQLRWGGGVKWLRGRRCREVTDPSDMPGNDRTCEGVMGELGDSACGHALARLVGEVADQVAPPDGRVFVMSHSLGGQIAMNYALLHPSRVAGLALLSPAPLFVPHRMLRPYWLVHAMTHWHKLIDKTPLRVVWRQILRLLWIAWGFTPRISPDTVAHGQRRLHEVDFWAQRERCARLKQQGTPTLMAWSLNDPMIESELHHQLSQSLPGGPRLVFKDGGHFINKHHAG
eukprot:CAMPEP_0114124388 /NCGR_PEP_ID=MMETSP0043_2-20121206/8751_1 /TAXON_ID=464988 /ORGANISM="Hemiselmis andersenii, Strain CCMP644" /LENGTH=336 /DNA_ID=CAMNT_0001217265 /DNA_START=177 /DNA_END=1185 /DNA_ORIENTATION=+